MKLKNDDPIDWYNWKYMEIESLRNLYVEIGWCKEYKDKLKNYEMFLITVKEVSEKIEDILELIIIKTKGLKRFMSIHSVFNIHDNIKGDWFVKFIINILKVTDEEIYEAHRKDEIPEEIMSKLSIFDPKPLGFEKYIHDIELHYKLWGNWKKYEQTDPIKIFNRTWESIGKKMKNNEIENILSKFDIINCE